MKIVARLYDVEDAMNMGAPNARSVIIDLGDNIPQMLKDWDRQRKAYEERHKDRGYGTVYPVDLSFSLLIEEDKDGDGDQDCSAEASIPPRYCRGGGEDE